MRYKCYYLEFPNGIHIGASSLDDSELSFTADTLFSALYQEAMASGKAEWLLENVQGGRILLSDAYPFLGDTLYVPRPLMRVNVKESKGDSVKKKAFKKLGYIPMDGIGTYLKGNLDAVTEAEKLKEISKSVLKVSAAIHGEDETRPYVVGVRYFGRDTGLYVVIAAENEEQESAMYDLLLGLSYSGIGGKRRAGIGRFVIVREKVLDSKMFEQTSKCVMSMSISLPKEDEMEMVMENAHIQVKKRGGFVASETYADEPLKKRELNMLAAGSTFAKRFTGDVYDVSVAGNHPVYRYGRPMFLALPEVK